MYKSPYEYCLPEYIINRVKSTNSAGLGLWRNRVIDTIESISDGTYYQRPSFITGEYVTWYNPTEKVTRYWLDAAYHHKLLETIEAEINARGELCT